MDWTRSDWVAAAIQFVGAKLRFDAEAHSRLSVLTLGRGLRTSWSSRAILLTALMAQSYPAASHSFYDAACCSGQDCAPVIRSELLQPSPLHTELFPGLPALPVLWVETKHGKGIVPSTMIPRESKDEKVHVCIRDKKVICIYMPPIN